MNYSSDILKGFSRIKRAMCDFPNHWLAVYFRECADAHMLKDDYQQITLTPSCRPPSFDEGKHKSLNRQHESNIKIQRVNTQYNKELLAKDVEHGAPEDLSINLSIKQMLPSNASIFTAEFKAMDLALDSISENNDDHFIIFSDSLAVLFSLHNKKNG